jgi:acetoacetate decarboxylase
LQVLDSGLAPVPPRLGTVSIFPGKTLGGFYIASYGKGSSLQYNELIVFSALVRSGARIGAWVSDIYVDSEGAVSGGREIWGLPKQLAHFRKATQARARTVSVRANSGSLLCEVAVRTAGHHVKLPVLAPAWSTKGASVLWFLAKGTARVSHSRGDIRIPPASALAGRGIEGGRILLLDGMDVQIGPGALR